MRIDAVDFTPLILSFQVAALATPIAGVTGTAVGAWLSRARFPGVHLVDALLTAPMVLPPTVLGYYLLVAVGSRSFVGRAYEAVTGSSLVFTRTGVILAAALGGFPIVVKAARAALEDVDPNFVRAARTLGAGPVRAFLTVQLPLAGRGIVASVMLAFVRALGDFGVTLMIGGDIPGETQTASLAIYDAVLSHREAEALVMAVLLSVFAISVLYAVNRMTAKHHAR